MSNHYYVDTSVLLSLYREESISELSEDIVNHNICYISSLTEVEFHSALARWVRMNEITEDEALLVEKLFTEELHASVYQVIQVNERNYWQATQWLQQRTTSLRTLDALQLSICKSAGCDLLTADKPFSRSATKIGVTCRLVEPQ